MMTNCGKLFLDLRLRLANTKYGQLIIGNTQKNPPITHLMLVSVYTFLIELAQLSLYLLQLSAYYSQYVLLYFFSRKRSADVIKEFIVTTGVKLTNSKSITTKVGFEYSLKSSLGASFKGITAGVEATTTISSQLETSLMSSEDKFWSKQTKTIYTAPAGKRYRIVQTLVDFSSPLEADNVSLYLTERIEETDQLGSLKTQ